MACVCYQILMAILWIENFANFAWRYVFRCMVTTTSYVLSRTIKLKTQSNRDNKSEKIRLLASYVFLI